MAIDMKQMKAKLMEERAQLEKQLSDLGIMDPETGDWGAYQESIDQAEVIDKNDAADVDEDFAIRASTIGEIEKRYLDIKHALAKIDKGDGSYGTCEVSGEPIEEDRLMANPAARTSKAHMNE